MVPWASGCAATGREHVAVLFDVGDGVAVAEGVPGPGERVGGEGDVGQGVVVVVGGAAAGGGGLEQAAVVAVGGGGGVDGLAGHVAGRVVQVGLGVAVVGG